VADKVIVELQAARTISEDHEDQLINYLKATDVEVGLLLNFGQRPEFRRKLFQNPLKHKIEHGLNGSPRREGYPAASVPITTKTGTHF
jgi:hypothetical protein